MMKQFYFIKEQKKIKLMNKGNKNLKIGIKEDYYQEIIKKINCSQINSGKVLVQTVERSLIR